MRDAVDDLIWDEAPKEAKAVAVLDGGFAAWQRGARFSSNGSPRMAEGQEIFPAPDDLPLGPPE